MQLKIQGIAACVKESPNSKATHILNFFNLKWAKQKSSANWFAVHCFQMIYMLIPTICLLKTGKELKQCVQENWSNLYSLHFLKSFLHWKLIDYRTSHITAMCWSSPADIFSIHHFYDRGFAELAPYPESFDASPCDLLAVVQFNTLKTLATF